MKAFIWAILILYPFLPLVFSIEIANAGSPNHRGSRPFKVAITVDDLPYFDSNELPPNKTWLDVDDEILTALAKYRVPGAYGFVNYQKVDLNPETKIVLERWLAAGQKLGNHGYGHKSINNCSSQEFINEINVNETRLRSLEPDQSHLLYRFPNLQEGDTVEKRNAVRDFLKDSAIHPVFPIAQVTIDFADFRWNEPYLRCLQKNDQQSVQWLKESFLYKLRIAVTEARYKSKKYFCREVDQIALFHFLPFTSKMMPAALKQLAKDFKAEFIPTQRAVLDEAYQNDPQVPLQSGLAFFEQLDLSTKELLWQPKCQTAENLRQVVPEKSARLYDLEKILFADPTLPTKEKLNLLCQ